MRLGISSYTYTWAVGVPGYMPHEPMTARGLLNKAAELDVRVVQIADNMPLDRLSDSELDDLAQSAAELGISIEVGTRGIARDHLRNYLQLAQRLGSPMLRVVVDTADHQPSEDEAVDLIRAVIPEFEAADVCLAIENHDRFTTSVLTRILDRVESIHTGVCLDTVNSFGALEGPEVVVEKLGPRTVNLHVKDFSIYRAGHQMGFTIEGRPAGEGRLDVPWLIREIQAHGRDPNAILELWTPLDDTVESTVAREAGWADTSIQYLRQLIPD